MTVKRIATPMMAMTTRGVITMAAILARLKSVGHTRMGEVWRERGGGGESGRGEGKRGGRGRGEKMTRGGEEEGGNGRRKEIFGSGKCAPDEPRGP